MNRILKFIKDHYVVGIGLMSILFVLVVGLVFRANKATFSIETSNDSVSITCPQNKAAGEEFECQITSNINSFTALSVNANYVLPAGVSYVSFSSGISCDDVYDCVIEGSSKGFAVGNINGLIGNVEIGTVKFKIADDVVVNNIYNIGLANIEVTDKNDGIDYKMVDFTDTYTSVKIIAKLNEDELKFDDSLVIDEDNMIIERVILNTTYSSLGEKITTIGSISYVDNNGNALTENDIVKTGDKIVITVNDNSIVYTVSVLGDLTGDGVVKINDISKLYRYLKGRINIEQEYISAGDIIESDTIKINDVSRLYRYLKERVSSLEVE